MADTSILDKSVSAAPKAYTIAGSQEIVLKAVTASFDGSGAAGSYVPAVQIVDPSGFVVGTYTVTTQLAAGVSADVSWFPGVGDAASSSTGAIRFDTNNQGGWLDVTTNNADAGGHGMHLVDASGSGINVDANNGGGITLQNENGGNIQILGDAGVTITSSTGTLQIEDFSGNGVIVSATNGGDVEIRTTGVTANSGILLATNSADGGGVTVNDAGSGGIHVNQTGTNGIELHASSATDTFGILLTTTNTGGHKPINLVESSGGGIALVADSGLAPLVASTYGSVYFKPGTAAAPIVLVSEAASGQPAIVLGVNGTDWVSIYDVNAGTPIERFRFYANGHCDMLGLPSVNPGGSGRVWNNAGVLNIT